jgi:hypothetical protein
MFVGPKGQLEKRLKIALPFGHTLHKPNLENMLDYMKAFEILGVAGYEDVPDFLGCDVDDVDLRRAREYYEPSNDTGLMDHYIPGSFLSKVYETLTLADDRDILTYPATTKRVVNISQ